MSKPQDALKALKPATDDNDSPVLQSEYDALRQENERLKNAIEMGYGVQDGYEEQVKMLEARLKELLTENARLTARVEQLRGLCQSAAGWLGDAGDGPHAARVLELVGDQVVADFACSQDAQCNRTLN